MKQISFLIVLSFFSALIFTSCDDTTFAKELKIEKKIIEDYVKRNNINVITSAPADNAWGANDFILTESGLYFHLSKAGAGDDVETSNKIVPRYIQYTLVEPSDTLKKWTTTDFLYPEEFIYGNTTQSCPAFHEAVSYMKKNGSEAKIIVPSKIGFQANWTPATPMGYLLKIQIQK